MGPLPPLTGGFGPAEKMCLLRREHEKSMNAEDNSGGGFAVSVYDEHWQIQLVMDLSG